MINIATKIYLILFLSQPKLWLVAKATKGGINTGTPEFRRLYAFSREFGEVSELTRLINAFRELQAIILSLPVVENSFI